MTIAAVDWDIKPRIKQKWFDPKFSSFSIFSSDCYAGINMTERHQREDFAIWPPPVQVSIT